MVEEKNPYKSPLGKIPVGFFMAWMVIQGLFGLNTAFGSGRTVPWGWGIFGVSAVAFLAAVRLIRGKGSWGAIVILALFGVAGFLLIFGTF
jgi:hypothetical protein